MSEQSTNKFDSPFAAAVAKVTESEKTNPTVEEVAELDSLYRFTDEEQKMIDTYADSLDITDSATALNYGSDAQKKVSEFADSALAGVKTKDFGETGTMIANLLVQLKGLDEDEKKGFLSGLFKRTRKNIEVMKVKYSKAEDSVNEIVKALENHQIVLMKDIALFDNLYEINLSYIKELTMYIAAGKQKLEHERNTTLAEMKKKAEESGLPEDAQAANDFAEKCTRFERRLYDLELTRTVAIQTAPQIRLLQNNDTMMTEKIQTVIMNTIPLWKNQMVISLGIAHSQQALETQKGVTDMTNELLKKNADSLHQATVEIAKESERGIVDIETLSETNKQLIATLDDVRKIQEEGGQKRKAAEAELARIETELKEKLLEVSSVAETKTQDQQNN